MLVKIETLSEKKIVGNRARFKLSELGAKTAELWKTFMPQRMKVKQVLDKTLLSVQVCDEGASVNDFDPNLEVNKWAAVEVSGFDSIPEGMETYTIQGGLYAVFSYTGTASGAVKLYAQIFGTWLPASGYVWDNRPQFEILGENYNPNDPNSSEEIWIPIKNK